MRELIGMCIDNTTTISSSMVMSLQINDSMNKIKSTIDSQNKLYDPEQLRLMKEAIGVVRDKYTEYMYQADKRPKL